MDGCRVFWQLLNLAFRFLTILGTVIAATVLVALASASAPHPEGVHLGGGDAFDIQVMWLLFLSATVLSWQDEYYRYVTC